VVGHRDAVGRAIVRSGRGEGFHSAVHRVSCRHCLHHPAIVMAGRQRGVGGPTGIGKPGDIHRLGLATGQIIHFQVVVRGQGVLFQVNVGCKSLTVPPGACKVGAARENTEILGSALARYRAFAHGSHPGAVTVTRCQGRHQRSS